MKTSEKIIQYLKEKKRATPKDIIRYLGLTPPAVFRQLKKLLNENEISKIGQPPKVFYILHKKSKKENQYQVSINVKKFIEDRFFDITPSGEMESGWRSFVRWCERRGQDVITSAQDYVKIIRKYDSIKRNGLISGIQKLRKTFPNTYLDHLFYLDFYSVERFGKTRLGKLLLYAKQSQNKLMIKKIVQEIKPKIDDLIKKYNIDLVGFVPPTVKREVQFMKELESNLNLRLNKINIIKIKTPIIIPQKTLNKIEDRIENAEKTFVVSDNFFGKNVLLIDDAVGSGATLNEIAKQIKEKRIVKGNVIGLVITGSLKGFDVISEV